MPRKLLKRDVNRHIQAKLIKYDNLHYRNYTTWIMDSNQVLHNDKDHQLLFVFFPTCVQQTQDGGRNLTWRRLSALLTLSAVKDRIYKIEDGGQPPVYKQLNHYIYETKTPRNMPQCRTMPMWTIAAVEILNFTFFRIFFSTTSWWIKIYILIVDWLIDWLN